jgi:hypothetical protein
MELCNETEATPLVYRGKIVRERFVAELAVSNQSRCKKCKSAIKFNEFRIGSVFFIPGHGRSISFQHARCFQRPPSLENRQDLLVIDSLTEQAHSQLEEIFTQPKKKKRLRKRIKECPNTPYIFHFCYPSPERHSEVRQDSI